MSDQLEFNPGPEIGICPHCSHKIVEYKFGLNKGLVAFLAKLGAAGKPVALDELGLTNSQYGNYAKTRFWGLAEQMKPETEIEQRKGGKWRLTETGLSFISNTHAVPKYVFTLLGKVTRFEGPDVHVTDVDETYEYKGDYREQAADQLA